MPRKDQSKESPSGPPRSSEIYAEVKRRITDLRMPPGSWFSQHELAKELGISQTPVREALIRLSHEGLVEAIARSGYRVSEVTLRDIKELLGLRRTLEIEAAGLAAENASEADVKTLESLEKLCRTRVDPSDPSSISRFLEAYTCFHVSIARIGGNRIRAFMLNFVLSQLERLVHLAIAGSSTSNRSRTQAMVHEHQELLKAIKTGNPEAARLIADRTAKDSGEMILDALMSTDAALKMPNQ